MSVLDKVHVRALIAEDEAPARDSLRAYLATTPWIDVVAEAVDGRTALADPSGAACRGLVSQRADRW